MFIKFSLRSRIDENRWFNLDIKGFKDSYVSHIAQKAPLPMNEWQAYCGLKQVHNLGLRFCLRSPENFTLRSEKQLLPECKSLLTFNLFLTLFLTIQTIGVFSVLFLHPEAFLKKDLKKYAVKFKRRTSELPADGKVMLLMADAYLL